MSQSRDAIDPNVPGTYTLDYTASNGFATTTIPRTIHVVGYHGARV